MYAGIFGALGILSAFERILIFSFFAFLLIFFCKKYKKFDKPQIFMLAGVFLLFFSKGYIEEQMNQSVLSPEEKNFMVVFQEPIKLDGNYFSAYGKEGERKEKVAVRYYIRTKEEKEKIKKIGAGAVCPVKGNLKVPQGAKNENAFNYREFLYREKIHWIVQAENIELDQCRNERGFFYSLLKWRKSGIEYIEANFPQETAPIAEALIFGYRHSFEEDLLDAYEKLGIVHLLAISGLHVSLLTGLIFYSGLRIGIPREKMIDFLIAFLPAYIILTGASPSVVRAGLMMLIVLLFSRRGENKYWSAMDGISIVFCFYLFCQPYIIYHIAFQLSFLVTFFLILSGRLLKKYSSSYLFFLASVTFVSQLASIPVLLWNFYEISLFSFIVNIFYVPLYSAIVLPALLMLFVAHLLFGKMADPLLSLAELFFSLLNNGTKGLAQLPFSTLVIGKPSLLFLILFLVSIFYFFFQWEKRGKFPARHLPFIAGLFFIRLALGAFSVYGEVTMIDVGQGDSIFIRLPFNRGTYLIDTGGVLQFETEEWEKRRQTFDPGKDILLPYLKSKGIRTIDKLIITHGDADHAGGAIALLKELAVREIVMPDVSEKSDLEKGIIAVSEQKGIPVRFAKRGDKWTSGEHVFAVLAPEKGGNGSKNDQSIVIYSEIGGLRWLFTGDLEEDGEKKLLARYPSLKVDVLKVGHHGSKTSTSEPFLEAYKPRVALISAGENNRFGHPHNEVVERLKKRNAAIFRTDEDGAITYRFKGKSGTFFTQIP